MKTDLHFFKKHLLICLGLLAFLSPLEAQLFYNASANLPQFGATRQSMDVQAADLDKDGDLDIILANEFQPNIVLTNDGQGNFSQANNLGTPQHNHDSEDVAIADFDRDGDLDLVFCTEDGLGGFLLHEYWTNDGNGFFAGEPGGRFRDSKANAVIVADLNNDSIPDLIFGNDGGNDVYINNGEATFTLESEERIPGLIRTTQDLSMTDVDMDGDPDLFVGNENGNNLLINNGEGIFTDESDERLPQGLNIETRKVAFGDINGDGAPDIFLSNVQFIAGRDRQNRLFLNDGNGYFSDVTSTHLPTDNEDTLDGIFLDIDSDGDQDLVIANVNLNVPGKQRVYLNNGDGQFTDETLSILGNLYSGNMLGVVAADFDGNGTIDLYFCDRNTGNSNKDLLLLKSSPNSTSSIPFPANVKIYPNPIQDSFSIQWPKPITEPLTLRLFDTKGTYLSSLIYHQTKTDQLLIKVNRQELVRGIYILQITTEGKVFSKKLRFDPEP